MSIKVAQILIPLENDRFLTPLQKLPKNEGDLGKLIVANGFKKLPKVQQTARSGHTDGGPGGSIVPQLIMKRQC